MIIAFKTADMDKFFSWVKGVNDVIKSNKIGVVFKTVDYEYFKLYKDAEVFYFLVLLRVEYTLINLIPRFLLVNRIKKSLEKKGGVTIELLKPVQAFSVLIDFGCGFGVRDIETGFTT